MSGLRMVRVVHAERDGRGDLWLRVELADGSTVQLEPSAVPAHLKRAFLRRVKSAHGVDLGAADMGSSLLDELRERGGDWLDARLWDLARLGTKLSRLYLDAVRLGADDLASRLDERRKEIRKVRDALTTIQFHLFPEWLNRGGPVDLGVVPALAAAVKILALLAITTVAALAAYMVARWADVREFELKVEEKRIEAARENPDLAPHLLGDREKTTVWETAAKVAVGIATGVGVAVAVPAVVRAIRGR